MHGLAIEKTVNQYTIQGRYFTSDNEPNGIKMRPTLHFRKSWLLKLKCPAFFENILWGAFFIPLGSFDS
jgi:hypothetical protein